MCNNFSTNVILVATTVSIWLYNNLPCDLVNYLANLFQIIGQNLSSMLALEVIPSSSSDDEKKLLS